MKYILQKWLQEILGIMVEMEKLDSYMRDGTLFVQILQHYSAINLSTVDIQPSLDNIVRRINLIQLKAWFKLLNIDFNNKVIEDILEGKISTCINILHQLYLCFENKTSLLIIPKQKERLLRKSNNKFKVNDFSLTDLQQTKPNHKIENRYKYSDRILEHKDVIGWYKDKYVVKKNKPSGKTTFLKPIDKTNKLSTKDINYTSKRKSRYEEDIYYVRNELNRFCSRNNNGCDYRVNNNNFHDSSFVIGDKLTSSKFNTTSKLNKCRPDSSFNNRGHFLPPISVKDKQSVISTCDDRKDNYLEKLEFRMQSSFKKRKISKRLCDFMINDIWGMILNKEEDDLKKIIGRKLLKQSLFEKVWVMRLYQIMNQSEVQKLSYSKLKCLLERKRDLNNDTISSECSELNDEDNLLSYRDYVVYYHNERKRTVELHRRLYAEKLKLTFEKHYALCLQTVEDIVDVSIKISEFKDKYDIPVTERFWTEWKQLFFHGLPVYICDHNLFVNDNETVETDSYQFLQQNILNSSDLDDYLNIEHEWKHVFESSDTGLPHGFASNSEHLLLIGFIVHKLLQLKYPSLPPPKPADIPMYPIRVILNDINDKEAIMKFSNLLNAAEILVVDVNSAVNFCLSCYKNDMGLDLNELTGKKYSQYSSGRASVKSLSFDVKKLKELEDKFKEQSTQTSQFSFTDLNDSSPSENVAAKLGKELFNSMLFSNELSTALIVDVIIEYIKSNQDKIKGWVLVNFPSTLYQASILENALSGKIFPYFLDGENASKLGSDIGPLNDMNGSSSYIAITVQSSRIVPNPKECDGKDVFKTYFSKFVTTIKGETKLFSSTDEFPLGIEDNSMHSESTLLLEHPEREGVPTINEFYRDQGILHELLYEKYDLNTLKLLAHVIFHLGDDDSSQVTSVDLFGKDILNKLMDIDETITGHADNLSTKPVENLVSSLVVKYSDLSDSQSSYGSIENSDKIEAVSRPGDKNWVYANDPIPENLAFSLASFWEGLEAAYLNDLKNVFCLKRNTDCDLIPYIHYTTKIMKSCFNLKDDRQDIVTEFLNKFNGVHTLLRSDEDMKIELHLRIEELRENLVKLCENERDYSEGIRNTIINQNWTYLQMAAISNCFISMLQIEADRCTRVLEFVRDYYYAMLGLFKAEPLNHDLPKLSKMTVSIEESEENVVASKIIQSLVNPNWSSTSLTNPVYAVFENKANEVCTAVENIKSVLDNIIAGEETSALKIHKDFSSVKQQELLELEKKRRQSKDFKKRKSSLKEEEFLKEINDAKLNLSLEMEKKEQSIKNFFLEWSAAVKVEVERTLFRIGLIKKKAYIDLMEIEICMSQTFNHFYDLVMSKLEKECVCIDQLCTLFHVAVEERTPVHGDIVFRKDRLFVLKRDVERMETILKLPPGLEEMLFEESFTIKQLEEMKNRLMYVAPSGIISQEAFVTLIETMIIEGSSHGSIKLVPNIWHKLKSNEFSVLFVKVFGNSGVVAWRDFLINCLDVPYPVTEDIIDARLQFLYHDPQVTETVSYKDYMNTTLWFHRELPESPLQALHNVLAKEFLFSLYRVTNEDLINYMALLMAFCKDEDVKIGFGKGLSLMYGRCVIVFEEDLYLEQILSDHIHTGSKIVNHILNELIEDVAMTASGILDKSETDFRYREQSLADLGLKGSQSSLDRINDFNDLYPQLTESMYDQFFRRHRTLRWTSKVPFVVVITLITVSFYPLLVPHYTHELYSQVFEKIRTYMTNLQESGEDYIYAPMFLENIWLENILNNLPKFKALSFTNVIKEILAARDVP